MQIHSESHSKAGITVPVLLRGPDGPMEVEAVIEDWWDRVHGESWMAFDGNPAALNYAMRVATFGLPFDDEVVYGKVQGLGHLIHVTELIS